MLSFMIPYVLTETSIVKQHLLVAQLSFRHVLVAKQQ